MSAITLPIQGVTEPWGDQLNTAIISIHDDAHSALAGVASLRTDVTALDGRVTRVEQNNGTTWFSGDGPPQEPVAGAESGDYYLDKQTGNVYQLS